MYSMKCLCKKNISLYQFILSIPQRKTFIELKKNASERMFCHRDDTLSIEDYFHMHDLILIVHKAIEVDTDINFR